MEAKHAKHPRIDPHERRRRVLRIFDEESWGNLELVDAWDGEDVDELRNILGEEEFQILLDRLADVDEGRR
jgi:hypothetical protein